MNQALGRLVSEWLVKALHDLQTARIIANAPEGPLDTAIYHCQQAAEKALKGWLTSQSIQFERTHDVRRLVRQAAAGSPDFDDLIEAAEILTPYASAFRYPGLTADMVPTRVEFDEALAHATEIYDFVDHLLRPELDSAANSSSEAP